MSSREKANAIVSGHSSLAIVNSLVFGFAVSSFLDTSSDWYEDAISEGGDRKKAANSYANMMALVCIMAVAGLILATMRIWTLMVTYAYHLEKLEGMITVGEWIDNCVSPFTWTAVGCYIIGLILYSRCVFELGTSSWKGTVSIFAFGILLSIIISARGVCEYYRNKGCIECCHCLKCFCKWLFGQQRPSSTEDTRNEDKPSE